jgi:hypothetical protein
MRSIAILFGLLTFFGLPMAAELPGVEVVPALHSMVFSGGSSSELYDAYVIDRKHSTLRLCSVSIGRTPGTGSAIVNASCVKMPSNGKVATSAIGAPLDSYLTPNAGTALPGPVGFGPPALWMVDTASQAVQLCFVTPLDLPGQPNCVAVPDRP